MIKFKPEFAQFVCNQLPVGFLSDLYQQYSIFHPEEDLKELKEALDRFGKDGQGV